MRELKKDTKSIQQKGRPVSIHFEKSVRCDLEKLIEKGQLEKADDNCFIPPAVITIKNSKSAKIALDFRKQNESCVKRKIIQTAESRVSCKRKEDPAIRKRVEVARLPHASDRVKPLKDKTETITELEAPKNVKELKSFLGSIQDFSKFINNLSKKTDRTRRLLKKGFSWEWTFEKNEDLKI